MATGHEWGAEVPREIGGISPEGVDVDIQAGTLSFGINIPPRGLTENWAKALIEVVAGTNLRFSIQIPHEGKQIFVSDVRVDEEAIVDVWLKVDHLVKAANRRYEEMRKARNDALAVLERAGTRVAEIRPSQMNDGQEG